MEKLLPEPIAFAGSMIFLSIAVVAFALLNPEFRLWLENTPQGLNTAVGAFAGTVIGLLAIAAAIVYHGRLKYGDKETAEAEEARVLAAAIHGEIVALTQWLASQAARAPDYRSNEATAGSELAGFATRPVYEANAGRLELLGPDLAAAVAYCHAIFEHAEWEHNAALSNGTVNGNGSLQTVEAKLRTTADYLAAFAKNGPGQIDQAGRDAIFATSEDDREALA
ncbi:MAG: hypothetical protein OXT01_01235 [Rhodospirillaceae bacterium]|nr:hypothetical protein [Rhodospirillaceae bacterium]